MLWYHSQLLLPALTVIADASRDGESLRPGTLVVELHADPNDVLESWRLPFGQAGILDLALNIIATHHTGNDLLVHALRLVGNSCADAGKLDDKLSVRQS